MLKKISAIAIIGFALPVVLGTVHQAMAQDATTPYPKMAPVDQYLMADRAAEIALARSAAPESISHDAEVQVLGRHSFETAVKGTTASCVSWDARGHPLRMLTFGIRKCGFPRVLTRQPHVLTFCASAKRPSGDWRGVRKLR